MSLTKQPSFSNVAGNAGWLMADRVGRILIAFSVNIVVARHLGPDTFGAFSFIQASVAIVSFAALAAIEAIVVRMLVDEPLRHAEILGSALALRALGGLVVVLLASGVAYFGDAPGIAIVVAPIIAAATVFQSLEVADYWLRLNLQSRFATTGRLSALALGAGFRIAASLSPHPILALSIAILVESIAVATGLWIAMWKAQAPRPPWHPDVHTAISILKQSWPLVLSAVCVALYVRLGYLAIGSTSGMADVGIFSAAMLMAEALHIPATAIAATIGPVVLNNRRQDPAAFDVAIGRMFRLGTLFGICVAGITSWVAPVIVPALLGEDYAQTGPVLAVLSWSIVFVYMSITTEYWFIGHGLQSLLLPKTACSALIYVCFVYPAAHHYGVTGVAIVTIGTFSFSALWSNLLFARTRPLFARQLRSLTSLR